MNGRDGKGRKGKATGTRTFLKMDEINGGREGKGIGGGEGGKEGKEKGEERKKWI